VVSQTTRIIETSTMIVRIIFITFLVFFVYVIGMSIELGSTVYHKAKIGLQELHIQH